jgi:hypothetical protein
MSQKSNPKRITCSFVTASGRLKNKITYTPQGVFRFSLETEDGTFYVQGRGIDGLDCLAIGTPLIISGHLRSFYVKKCQLHHHYLEPLLVLPLAEGQTGQITQHLVDLWRSTSTPPEGPVCFDPDHDPDRSG